MNLPKDNFMLLSYINTKLRDEFSSLKSFCENHNVSIDEIKEKLSAIDYFYNQDENQFK